jgi:hypothetical protein
MRVDLQGDLPYLEVRRGFFGFGLWGLLECPQQLVRLYELKQPLLLAPGLRSGILRIRDFQVLMVYVVVVTK